MKNTARTSLFLTMLAMAAPALAQRVQFASPLVSSASSVAATPVATTGVAQTMPAATWGPPTSVAQAAPLQAAPGYGAPYAPPMAAPQYTPPVYPQPSATPTWVQPGAMPQVPPAPYATLNGTIQTPSPAWDPYATPGAQPQPLFPQDPYLAQPAQGSTFNVGQMQRFIDHVHLNYTWMPGGGPVEMGVNEFDTGVTFALPFLYNAHAPLFITPSFGGHWFNGPSGPAATDVPPYVFDAYIASEWYPQPLPWLGGELGFTVGLYSDFKKLDDDSVRFLGRGLLVLSLSPSFKLKGGIWYLDRNRVKLLPAGGVVWTPNPDTRFDILFPNPKAAHRIWTRGATDWWLYLRGEYGDGSWTTETDTGILSFDYNDIRVAVGIDFISPSRLNGYFEAGIAFDREIYYNPSRIIYLNPCALIGGGIRY